MAFYLSVLVSSEKIIFYSVRSGKGKRTYIS